MIYRFGAYELDDSARELRKDGVRVVTEPKAFELLVYLAQNSDRAVSKEELLNELWPRQIVTETALTRCVMKARRAVGDDSDKQSVIRTLHGHGYRFVAELAAEPTAGPEAGDQSLKRRSRRLPIFGAAAVVLVLAFGWFLAQQNPARAQAGTVAVLPVANMVETDDYSWVRVGLMSLLARMLEDGGLDVADERRVLAAVSDESLAAPPDSALFDRIRREADADTVLHTALDTQGGLRRLTAVITHPDGTRTRRMIVGEAPASLAAELAGVLSELLSRNEIVRPERFSKVSTDPFVNELYARALDLEMAGELSEARELFRVAASQEPEHFWLNYEIALCTRDLREWDEAEPMFRALQARAENGDDPRALVVAYNSHGIMKLNRNRYEEAAPLFERALAVAIERNVDAGDRTSPLINLALVADRLGNPGEARRYYERAEKAYEEAGEQPSPFFHNNFAGLLLSAGDLDTARQHSEAAIEGFRLRGQRRYEAPALNRLAKILRRQGDIEGAIDRHEQALAIYRHLDNVVGELSVLLSLTSVYRAQGDLTRARHNIDAVLDRADEHDDDVLTGDAYIYSGHVASDRGDYETAMAEFEAARVIFERLGDDAGLKGAQTGIIATAIALGNLDRARRDAGKMLDAALEQNHPVTEAHARWLLGRVAASEGDAETARRHFGDALAYARAGGDTTILASAGRGLAELELGQGNVDAAAALIEEIRPYAGTEHDFARLEAALARAQGDTTRATAILTELRARAGEAWTADDEQTLAALAGR